MLILHCSDFHGNQRWYDWLMNHAANYDLVCLTGDHLDLFNYQQLGGQMRMVNIALREITTPSALCSGNHDSFSGESGSDVRLFQAQWLKGIDRPQIWVDGARFELCGQTLQCIGWNSLLPPAKGDEIWLHHAPPANSLVSMGCDSSDAGDQILGEICCAGKGPRILLSGHQHNPRSWTCRVGHTWCFNPGYNRDGLSPNHIAIDTAKNTALLNADGASTDAISLV